MIFYELICFILDFTRGFFLLKKSYSFLNIFIFSTSLFFIHFFGIRCNGMKYAVKNIE